jgi:hypothetical protein
MKPAAVPAAGRSALGPERPAGWVVRGATAQGDGHLVHGTSCQDAFDWERIPVEFPGPAANRDPHVYILAVADGASSRRRSAQGASLAVGLAVDATRAELERSGVPADGPACRKTMEAVFDGVRRAFLDLVVRIPGADPREFATTLTVVLIAEPLVGLASVGDGFAVVRTGPRDSQRFHVVDYEVADAGEPGQASTGATFLTSPDAVPRRRVHVIHDEALTGVLVSTDGMENTLVDVDDRVFRTDQDALFDIMAHLGEASNATSGRILEFLTSADVAAHTRDDKTLLLAVRR